MEWVYLVLMYLACGCVVSVLRGAYLWDELWLVDSEDYLGVVILFWPLFLAAWSLLFLVEGAHRLVLRVVRFARRRWRY